jgi:hypothetical protein
VRGLQESAVLCEWEEGLIGMFNDFGAHLKQGAGFAEVQPLPSEFHPKRLVVQIANNKTKIGHARIGFRDASGFTKWYGFSLDDEENIFYGYGRVSEEYTVYENSVIKEFELSLWQYNKAMEFIQAKINKQDNYYNVVYSNCISFVDCVLKTTKISKRVSDIFTNEELKGVKIGYRFFENLRNIKAIQARIENNCKKGVANYEICKQIFESGMVCVKHD